MGNLPKVKAVGCFIESDNKFLILLRSPSKHEGGRWGLPAGEIKKGESNLTAINRELKEEINYVAKSGELIFVGEFKLRYKEMETIFFAYKIRLEKTREFDIDTNQRKEQRWVTPKECYKMPNCMTGLYTLIEKIYM